MRWRRSSSTIGAGRFLEQLLVPPLDGAFAFAQVDDVAMRIGQNLELDVACALDQPLEIYFAITKGCPASRRAACSALSKSSGRLTRRIPLPPPPAAALTISGKPTSSAARHQVLIAQTAFSAGHDRHTGAGHRLACGNLVAHRGDGVRGRTDKSNAFIPTGLGKVGTFSQEAITRMDSVGSGFLADLEDLVDHQIAVTGRPGRCDRLRRRSAHAAQCGRHRNRSRPCRMPSSRQARMIRTAISPRLAIRTFRNRVGVSAIWYVSLR